MSEESNTKEEGSKLGSIKPWNIYWIKGPSTNWKLLYGISKGGSPRQDWVDLTLPVEDMSPTFCWDEGDQCWLRDCLTADKAEVKKIYNQLRYKESRFYREVQEENKRKAMKTPPPYKGISWWKKLFLDHE